jgi:hypothetical protein
MAEQKLAKVHKGCTVDNEYCDERDYGYGCDSCRFYGWIIDEIIEDTPALNR